MDVNEVIESYVRDVAACLPRDKRNDVAFELRALLHEELTARAQVSGTTPDRQMAMALLKDFGRPAEAAQRYHARPALIAAADTHHFLIWALGGLVVLGMHAVLGGKHTDIDSMFLQWLGLLLIVFAAIDFLRRRRPDRFDWKPKRGPEWMPRSVSAISLVGLLLFPVFMYAAPQPFASLLLQGRLPVDGLALTPEFAASWQRGVTLVLLIALALQHGIALVLGSRQAWLRKLDVGLNLAVGVAAIAHASPMLDIATGHVFHVFRSAKANANAAPIFLMVGGMMVLFSLYYGWREWAAIQPAPASGHDAMA